jgi:hypothetical protein
LVSDYSRLLAQKFANNQTIYLVMDRTNWFRKNLLTIICIYDQRAIPIYFEVLPKLESSNLLEQKRIFTQVLPLCKKSILWF